MHDVDPIAPPLPGVNDPCEQHDDVHPPDDATGREPLRVSHGPDCPGPRGAIRYVNI